MPMPLFVKKCLTRLGFASWNAEARRWCNNDTAFLKYVSDRTLSAPVDGVLELAGHARAGESNAMNLNLAAPRFDSPIGGWRFTADRLGTPDPWGLPELRQHLRDGDGDVFVGHGASGCYAAILDAFVNPGDAVVLFDPGSPLFRVGAESRRARLRCVPLWNEEGRSRFLFDSLAKAMPGARLLVLSEPHNPTGGTFTGEDLERLAWLAQRHDVLVVLDESFVRFRYDVPQAFLVDMPAARGRLLRLGSMTPGYGLGSLRVGWVKGPANLLGAVALNASLNAPYVPTACQQAALRAIQAERDLFTPTLEQFRSKRQYTVDRLKAMQLDVSWPNGGFFCWVNVASTGLDGRAFAEVLRTEDGVLVGPGSMFGATGKDAVRVSFAVEDGRLREGLQRLARRVAVLRGDPIVESAKVRVSVPVEDRVPEFSRV